MIDVVERTDEELAGALQGGDAAAGDALLARHWEAAWRVAGRLTGDPSGAEDVAQAAFVRALRGIAGYDPGRAFRPWLFRIVRNEALNHVRARRRRSSYEARAARPDRAGGGVGRVDDAEAAAAALARLEPRQREPIALHYLGGLSYDEVAAALDCPRGTVTSRIRRGLKRLQTELSPGCAAGEALALLADREAAPTPPSGAALLAEGGRLPGLVKVALVALAVAAPAAALGPLLLGGGAPGAGAGDPVAGGAPAAGVPADGADGAAGVAGTPAGPGAPDRGGAAAAGAGAGPGPGGPGPAGSDGASGRGPGRIDGGPPELAAVEGAVRVVVRDVDGALVPDAEVRVWLDPEGDASPDPVARGRTDAAGRIRLAVPPVVPATPLYVWVRAGQARRELHTTAFAATDEVIELALREPRAPIAGRGGLVLFARGAGRPIARRGLSWYRRAGPRLDGAGFGHADRAGAVVARDLRPGRYELLVRAGGPWLERTVEVEVAAGEVAERVVELERGVTVTVRIDAPRPLDGEEGEVRLGGRLWTVAAGADGVWTFVGVRPGDTTLRVKAPGLAPLEVPVAVPAGVREHRLPPVRYAPAPGGAVLRGRLVTPAGAPLPEPEALFLAERAEGGGFAFGPSAGDAVGAAAWLGDGWFRIDGVPPGRYRLCVRRRGDVEEVRVAVPEGAGAEVDLGPVELRPIVLTRVVGRVVGPDRAPVGGARVTYALVSGPTRRSGGRVEADADGGFAFDVDAEGWRVQLTAAAAGLVTADPVDAEPPAGGGDVEVEVPLVRAARVSGRVLGPRSRRQGLEVVLRRVEGRGRASAPVDAEGAFAITGLRPGRYALHLERGDVRLPGPTRTFELAAGAAREVELEVGGE